MYEISCVYDYVDYLKDQIKRLELIEKYDIKLKSSNKEKTINYYKEGIRLLLQEGETYENYSQILQEYRDALDLRQNVIKKLYAEIKIIKKLQV